MIDALYERVDGNACTAMETHILSPRSSLYTSSAKILTLTHNDYTSFSHILPLLSGFPNLRRIIQKGSTIEVQSRIPTPKLLLVRGYTRHWQRPYKAKKVDQTILSIKGWDVEEVWDVRIVAPNKELWGAAKWVTWESGVDVFGRYTRPELDEVKMLERAISSLHLGGPFDIIELAHILKQRVEAGYPKLDSLVVKCCNRTGVQDLGLRDYVKDRLEQRYYCENGDVNVHVMPLYETLVSADWERLKGLKEVGMDMCVIVKDEKGCLREKDLVRDIRREGECGVSPLDLERLSIHISCYPLHFSLDKCLAGLPMLSDLAETLLQLGGELCEYDMTIEPSNEWNEKEKARAEGVTAGLRSGFRREVAKILERRHHGPGYRH